MEHLSQGPNADPMRFEDPVAEIKARVGQMVDKVMGAPVLWDDELAKEIAQELRAGLGQLEADSIVGSIIILARRAKFQNQKLIIGLETDWIPGSNEPGSLQQKAISGLLGDIDSLMAEMRKMGLDNVIIEHASKDELARVVTKRAVDTNTKLSNVVLFGSSDTLNLPAFNELRSIPGEARAFIAAVNPSELDEFYKTYKNDTKNQLKIRLMEMLCMALELAVGKEPPELPFIEPGSYDKVLRKITFLPHVERADYDEIRRFYNAARTALQAA
jgi:hypothetical protein